VLEDKNKLKKALKRRDQKKKKSAQRWDGITKEVEEAKMAKQVRVIQVLCFHSFFLLFF
jgi:hypothetical protein